MDEICFIMALRSILDGGLTGVSLCVVNSHEDLPGRLHSSRIDSCLDVACPP